MTRLEAINEVLNMLGEMRINSLDDMSPDAQNVSETLDIITREVCSDDEPFNIFPVTFKPDVNGEIILSDNILSIDVYNAKGQYRAIKSDGFYRIKDVVQNTYTINMELSGDSKINFEFEELDPIIQNYIVKKTTVRMVTVELGSGVTLDMALNDLNLASGDYREHNIKLDDCNFDDNSFNSLFHRYYDFID